MFILAEHSTLYKLFVDGLCVAEAKHLATAVALYFVVFYVFNLCFPKNRAKTLVFLQRYACQLSDTTNNAFIQRCVRAGIALMEKMSSMSETDAGLIQPSISSAAVAVNAEQAVNAQTAASDSKRKRARTSRCSNPVVKPTRNAARTARSRNDFVFY